MPGFSITLLLLPGTASDNAISTDFLLSLLDDPTNAPGWKWSSKTEPKVITETLASIDTTPLSSRSSLRALDIRAFEIAIGRACNALLLAEGEITDMDKIAGDGDCGLTLSAGASGQLTIFLSTPWLLDSDGSKGVLEALSQGNVIGDDVVNSMIAISRVAEEMMGGTSGALYSFVSLPNVVLSPPTEGFSLHG